MKTKFTNWLLFLAVTGSLFTACKKDKKITPAPTVTTVAATAITTTSATVGGSVSGDEITEVGICYSKTNATPTTEDSKITGTLADGNFTAQLTGLTTGSTYYIRAYASNAAGIGYGSVLTFMTGNAAPEAKAVKIAGEKMVGATLTASYNYSDAENDPESGTSYQWYAANDSIGATPAAINGANAKTYVLTDNEQNQFLYVSITPKASSGTSPGNEAKSYWYGPIGGETVTFTYNGASVTYGVITSSVTGKKWLDRNLGAPNAPTANDDWENYGDLFQWGRGDDGHQLINMTSSASSTTALNGVTNVPSSTDNPGHNKFITPTAFPPGDWRNNQNNNLWQGVNGTNNPCPPGWRVPTKSDWTAENLTTGDMSVAYSQLKITKSRFRYAQDGSIAGNNSALYWTSTIYDSDPVYSFVFSVKIASFSGESKASGYSVRCIKD